VTDAPMLLTTNGKFGSAERITQKKNLHRRVDE